MFFSSSPCRLCLSWPCPTDFDVSRKAGFEEGAEGDGENLKFGSNNSSLRSLFCLKCIAILDMAWNG